MIGGIVAKTTSVSKQKEAKGLIANRMESGTESKPPDAHPLCHVADQNNQRRLRDREQDYKYAYLRRCMFPNCCGIVAWQQDIEDIDNQTNALANK